MHNCAGTRTGARVKDLTINLENDGSSIEQKKPLLLKDFCS